MSGASKRLSFLLPLLGFAVLLGFSAVALLATLSGTRDITQLPSVLIGKPPPPTELALLTEPSAFLDLSAFSGEVTAVNFFASWCAPCRAEAPALEQLSQQLPIIGIAYKDKPEDTTAFLAQYGNPFRQIGVDADG
ncbi:MAG: redoxin family protein, partial [Pseudomonadota bacterium]|nr:redoxin family protein [Pseudomonadota bacterium]